MKVYEAVADAFIKEGTSTIFGLLGDGQVTWWSEMSKHPDIKIIDVRDEGAALSMAEGWSRITGKVGVCSSRQDGKVYVCDRENRRVQIFTADGEFISMWTGMGPPNDIASDKDGIFCTAPPALYLVRRPPK